MDNKRMNEQIIDYVKMFKIMEEDIMKDIISRTKKYNKEDLLFLEYYKDRFNYTLKQGSIFREICGREDIVYRATLVKNGVETRITMNDKTIGEDVIFNVYKD